MLTIGSLFSGVGGLELGLEWAGLGPVKWQVEIDPFCRQVLKKQWPEVRRYEDIHNISSTTLPSVDLICGGFPCQPFSTASHGRRTAIDLWPEMRRVVCDIRPRVVIAENVQLEPVEAAAGDLTDAGYSVGIVNLPAGVVGAPHQRIRWFVVAHTDKDGQPRLAQHAEMAWAPSMGPALSWETLPTNLGMDDGLSDRLDRLEALGNAVVPQCAELIGQLVRVLLNV
jgi:DNA (cytosine-5)-methyltransferase 1